MATAEKQYASFLKNCRDCSLEEVQYHLDVLQKIERGLKRR